MGEAKRASAHEIFTSVKASARRELERSNTGLFFSGLAGGLNISFGFMGVAVATAQAPGPWKTIFATIAYPLGFLLVILPRAQLFTENTLTPVVLALEKPGRETILGTARIWGVVLLANLIGAFIAAWLLAHLDLGSRLEPSVMRQVALHSFEGGWGAHYMRGVFGAWLVALLVWMLHSGATPLAEAVLVWMSTAMIYFAGFNHSVAGAVEGLYLANIHAISYLDWLWAFQAPITLGNATGGVFFVALLNWAQAVGAGEDVEAAERHKIVERVEQKVIDQRAEDAARHLARRHDVEHVQEKLDEKGERAHEIVRDALQRAQEDRREGGEEDA